MADKKKIVIVITEPPHNEKASIGFTIANGSITAGLEVSVFLTGHGVDNVRKKAADLVEAHPLENLSSLIKDFVKRGGTLWACTPCVKARGYTQEDFVEGTIITGASPMLKLLEEGAASLSF